MQEIFDKMSNELGIPKDKAEFVVNNFFHGVREEMRKPNVYKIMLPKFGKFQLREGQIHHKIINLIKKLRKNYNTRSRNSLHKLWKARQVIIKHHNEKRYRKTTNTD